ncbi:hypothetical protein HDU76_008968, partial [Blyttiomyces sp. JEL0837]
YSSLTVIAESLLQSRAPGKPMGRLFFDKKTGEIMTVKLLSSHSRIIFTRRLIAVVEQMSLNAIQKELCKDGAGGKHAWRTCARLSLESHPAIYFGPKPELFHWRTIWLDTEPAATNVSVMSIYGLVLDQITAFTSLDWNLLEGPIPDSLWQISSLSSIGLSHNHFNGTISAVIENMEDLETIDISYNDLTGTLPRFANLPSLSV